MFKNKHFAFFALLFSFIAGCKLFFTDDIQQKSAKLLDNVNSMILNPSEKKDSNSTQNNTSTSQNTPQNSQQLPNNNPTNTIEKEKEEIPKNKKTEQPETSQKIKEEGELVENPTIKKEKIVASVADPNTKTNTTATDTTENTSTLDDPTTHDNSKTATKQKINIILKGNRNTSLKGLNNESNDIQYEYNYNDYTYNSHSHSKPNTISGSYDDNYITKTEEDEFGLQKENDEEDKLETRLDNMYKFQLKETTNSVEQALEITKQIENDLDKIAFHRLKLKSQGRTSTEYEKHNAKEELSHFTKNKLESDITKLLNKIEKSLNAATLLITNNKNLQNDLSAKKTLDKLKSEISSLITKVKANPNKDHQAYPILYSKDYQTYKKLHSELQSVKNLLTRTGIVAR